MKNRYFFWLNVFIAFCTAAVIFNNLPASSSQAIAPRTEPGAAALTAQPPTYLVIVQK